MSTKLTLDCIRRAVAALDANNVPLEGRGLWCPYCDEVHTDKDKPGQECPLYDVLTWRYNDE